MAPGLMLIGLGTPWASSGAEPQVSPPNAVAPVPPPRPIDPKTGLPLPEPAAVVGIDPATGLPLPALPDWKSRDWADPGIMLREVMYDGIPLSEVAGTLRREFKDQFDILIPSNIPPIEDSSQQFNPQSISVSMQLKNVRASEVFHAMNLLFDAENIPVRWELKLNGGRPLAMIRPAPARLVSLPIPKPPAARLARMVFPVSDLIGDSPGQYPKMQELVKTVSEIFNLSYETSQSIQFHSKAQLMVVTGTPDQIKFVQDTLVALREQPREAGKRTTPKATVGGDEKKSTN